MGREVTSHDDMNSCDIGMGREMTSHGDMTFCGIDILLNNHLIMVHGHNII
jgi:hypothetical protein